MENDPNVKVELLRLTQCIVSSVPCSQEKMAGYIKEIYRQLVALYNEKL
jgi:hypothetical protein